MKNMTSFSFVMLILLAIVIGCGGGKPVPQNYQGNWVGDNGTTIYMHADGKAGFKKANKNVDGGGAEIDESARTLTISLFGISETWKIDQEPGPDGEMRLGGVRFVKDRRQPSE